MNDPAMLSRRSMMAGAAWIGAGAMFSSPIRAFAAERSLENQWPAVAALTDGIVQSGRLPGLVAALGRGDKDPVFIARGHEGVTDADPISANTLFRMYSMTKPLTGLAVAMLIERRKLKLDQPLADVVPEFARMRVAIDPAKGLEARAATVPITIRHLLTHTAGLGYPMIRRDAVSNELARLGAIPAIVSRQALPGMPPPPPTPSADEFLRRVASVPLLAEPGTRWSYSIGLDVLGVVVARVSGKSDLAVFLEENLFGPAKMSSSGFRVSAGDATRLATNYRMVDGKLVQIDPAPESVFLDAQPFPFGGAGLVSTPADYDRFLRLMLNGGRLGGKQVVKERAVSLALSDILPAGATTDGTFVAGKGFGAGAMVGRGKSKGLWGWTGAAGTAGFINTTYRLRMGLYPQYMPSEALPLLSQFRKAVVSDMKQQMGF